MKPRKPPSTVSDLRTQLVALVAGFEKLGRKGDSISATTAAHLRAALTRDGHARRKPDVFTTCSECGDPVTITPDKRRPGGTVIHHLKSGGRCRGSDLPFAAHDEIRAERRKAPRVPVASLVGIFGPLEEGRA